MLMARFIDHTHQPVPTVWAIPVAGEATAGLGPSHIHTLIRSAVLATGVSASAAIAMLPERHSGERNA